MIQQYELVKAYIDNHRSEMLEMWRDFVETPSHTVIVKPPEHERETNWYPEKYGVESK